MSSTQVRADEATTNHEENNYGLFSLSADTGATSGSSLLLYVMAGIAILGMYLQYKSWKASRTTKQMIRDGREKPSLLRRLCDRGESSTTTLPETQPTPIVVRPPPCPSCTNRSPGVAQELLSSLLPVIRQQAMQLQSQIMRENTRILTDVQDVTADASIRMPAATSTPIKTPARAPSATPQAKAPYGTSAYGRPTYTAPPYSTPLSRSLPHTTDRASQTRPKRTLAASFCGYPTDIEEDSDE